MNKITPANAKLLFATALLSVLLLLRTMASSAQTNYTGSNISLVVSGTSTLHNWDMKSANGECKATFTLNGANISGLTAMSFSTAAVALKSEHSSMDNNAYKALKTEKNPAISYVMTSAVVTPGAGGIATVKCQGRLTIAGTTRDQELIATVKANSDNTLTVSGTRTISMKDFNMQPPTFMMGAIKTGNDITLAFNLTLKRS
ncbi:MAG TPA: YceI family protein [Puia sp.]|nr:YceI family protein [Puia sp.]